VSQSLSRDLRTSAGGLNAAGLAVYAGNLRQGVAFLESIWSDIHTHQVYRTDWYGVMRTALRWLATMAFGGFRRHAPVSLLDNSPLRDFLAQHLRLERIHEAVRTNDLRALCITASGYTSGASVSFFQGNPDIAGWQRSRRIGIPTAITVDHLLASAAIPLLFLRPYWSIGNILVMAPCARQPPSARPCTLGQKKSW
jgi:NTE family protein